MERLFIKKCKQCEKLIEKNLSERLLYDLMLQLIETSPKELQYPLFIEFTHLLGEHLDIPSNIVRNELEG